MTSRTETKYFIPFYDKERALDLIRGCLSKYGQEMHSRSYPVHSQYFDSVDKMCFLAKKEGLKKRFKVRLRHYEGEEHYLEWKIKKGEKISKIRHQINPRDIEEALVQLWPHERIERPSQFLRPSLEIKYQRTEFVLKSSDLRLTVDTQTCYRLNPSSQLWLETYGPHQSILEIKMNIEAKFDHYIWDLIEQLKLIRQSISKYSDSVQASLL